MQSIKLQRAISVLKFAATIAAIVGTLASCAHKSDYVPEVSGPGAMATKGGVEYSIPPNEPFVKMKIVSLGVNKDDLLLVRMYFKRVSDSKNGQRQETLDPKEQLLYLPDSQVPIAPSHVRALATKKPMIALGAQAKQAVEFQFPVGKRKDDNYPYFNVRWTIHYEENGKDKTEQQLARFDRKDKATPQGVGAQFDQEYPFEEDILMPDSSEWYTPGWLWW